MKKGFTLIEIIALVVILGILALILVPTIGNVIENSKKSRAERTLEGYVRAIDLAQQSYQTENRGHSTTNLDDLDISGSNFAGININSYLIENDGTVSKIDVMIDGYYCIYNKNSNATCSNDALLSQILIEKDYVSGNSIGLVKELNNEGYYYCGTESKVSNNYVWWAGILWRIVSIDSNNNLTLLSSVPLTNINSADVAWTDWESYKKTYINTWLNESKENNGVLYSSLEKEFQEKIVPTKYNIGVNGSIESEKTAEIYFGLLDVNQYNKFVGTDWKNSYINNVGSYILINTEDSSNILANGVSSSLTSSGLNNGASIRPVVKISNLVVMNDNKEYGSLTNPYRESKISSNTSNIKVGEYISVPYLGSTKYCSIKSNRCIFRVISVNDDYIKISLNGVLSSTKAFGNIPYSTSSATNTYLKSFYNAIDSKYKYAGTPIYFGTEEYKIVEIQNYADVWGTYLGASEMRQLYGLPEYGEFLTANDIHPTSDYRSVDKTAIENNSIITYGIMNANYVNNNQQFINYFSTNRSTYTVGGPTYAIGVRPITFLKKGDTLDLTFTKGDGTAQNPYYLGN